MSEKTTARLSLNVHPEAKQMLRNMAAAKGESMTEIVERMIRSENAASDHLSYISKSLKK